MSLLPQIGGCDYVMYYSHEKKKKEKSELTNGQENGTMSPVAQCACVMKRHKHAGIAQPVEQLIRNQQVVSSNLISSSSPRRFPTGIFLFEHFVN